ncbi:MAG: CBS domain-containing protein [Spirochaetaceae bacterium]|nr:MAG: CBS domain-containing protein [Spirochaetaceae bacterium]
MLEAFHAIETRSVSALPVICPEQSFVGVIGVNELISFTLAQNQDGRPSYDFLVANFPKVLPGKLLQSGSVERFSAHIMTGSMPSETAFEYLNRSDKKPLLVIGNRTDIIQFAVDRGFPAIVVTGVQDKSDIQVDFSSYDGAVFLSETDSVESIRLLRLSSPVRTIMDTEVPRVEASTLFDKAKNELINSKYRGLPVFDEGKYLGMISRRSFIERPRPKLIMVDHNEVSQAVGGAVEAEILEIVDHHRLAPPSTTEPIAVTTRVVGSTCTLVYEEFASHGLAVEEDLAILLLSGIVSDTVNLQSPTTTEADRRAIHRLETITGISASEHAQRLFSQITAMESRDAKEIVLADFKQYEHAGKTVGIGQVEVTTLTDSDTYAPRLQKAVAAVAQEQKLDWALLLVTDVIKRNSLLLTSDFKDGERALTYEKIGENTFDLPGVLSRKKQLLPEVMRVLDDAKQAG